MFVKFSSFTPNVFKLIKIPILLKKEKIYLVTSVINFFFLFDGYIFRVYHDPVIKWNKKSPFTAFASYFSFTDLLMWKGPKKKKQIKGDKIYWITQRVEIYYSLWVSECVTGETWGINRQIKTSVTERKMKKCKWVNAYGIKSWGCTFINTHMEM